jgi:hypothetical protein
MLKIGVVMLLYLDHAWEAHVARGRMRSIDDLYVAVKEGACSASDRVEHEEDLGRAIDPRCYGEVRALHLGKRQPRPVDAHVLRDPRLDDDAAPFKIERHHARPEEIHPENTIALLTGDSLEQREIDADDLFQPGANSADRELRACVNGERASAECGVS